MFGEIARDFAEIPVKRTPKYKVGIVGEIYVKYSPLGNNRLEQFLIGEDCEINMPGLMGFVQYCIVNNIEMVNLYGGSRLKRWALQRALNYIDRREGWLRAAVAAAGFAPPGRFERTRELSGRFIGKGVKMGEGWLLTGEMAELIESGFPNIICAQPFGCLPNHIAGRGMIPSLRRAYPRQTSRRSTMTPAPPASTRKTASSSCSPRRKNAVTARRHCLRHSVSREAAGRMNPALWHKAALVRLAKGRVLLGRALFCDIQYILYNAFTLYDSLYFELKTSHKTVQINRHI